MANVRISEITETAVNVSDNDLLLISKNNGSNSFTSAKIKGSNLNGLSKIKIVNDDVTVYLSTTGTDSNIENQFKNYGTDQQRNYPLYSLNAAVDFLWKFRAGKRINYYIVMNSGTYTYNKRQVLAHPDTNCNFYVNKNSSGISNSVTINPAGDWISEEQGTLTEHASYSNCLLLTTVGYWRIYNIQSHGYTLDGTGCSDFIFTSVNSDVFCENLNIDNFYNPINSHNKSYFVLSNSNISNGVYGIDMQNQSWMSLSGTNVTNMMTCAVRLNDFCQMVLNKGSLSEMNFESSKYGLEILNGSKCMMSTFNDAILNIKGGTNPLVTTKYDGSTNTSLTISDHKDVFYETSKAGITINLIKTT